MFRHILAARRIAQRHSNFRFSGLQTRCSSTRDGPDEKELKAARNWLKAYTVETIPKSIGEVSFSRSSGPGGQNVNKCVAFLEILDYTY